MAEQSTQGKEVKSQEKLSYMEIAVDTLKIFNEKSRDISKQVKEEESAFIFNNGTIKKYSPVINIEASILNDEIKDSGYIVELCEYIDIKDVSKDTKFKIRITDKNNCYVEFSYFEYREIMLDYTKSERDFIYDILYRMTGSEQNELDTIAMKICNYLGYLCHFKELQTKIFNSIGWDDYNGEKIFKYEGIYGIPRVPEEYDKENYFIKNAFTYKSKNIMDIADSLLSNNLREPEEIGDYLSQLVRVMKTSTKASLIIAAACTGLVRPLLPYSKEDNINMNIVGKRASGKSTICHFALSLFGDPQILEGSFVDSSNAMELIRVQRPVIPYILDERMLKVEDSSDKSKRQTILMDIFREYEGKAKEKLAGKGQEYSGQRTNAPIISSSVESMLDPLIEYGKDLGQYRRFIEIELDKSEIFEGDSSYAETIENIAYTYYGYGVELIVSYIMDEMLEEEEFVENKYEANRKEISETLKKREEETGLNGLTSSAKRFSLIITTLDIIIKSIEHYENNSLGFEFEKLCNEVAGILIDNLVDKMKRVNLKINVYDNITNFLTNHGDLFAKSQADYINDKEGKFIGYIDTKAVAYKQAKNGEKVLVFDQNRALEWIVAGDGYQGLPTVKDEIIKYVKYARADKKYAEKMFGSVIRESLEDRMTEEDKGRVRIDNAVKTKGGTQCAIYYKEKTIDGSLMTDEEVKEDK